MTYRNMVLGLFYSIVHIGEIAEMTSKYWNIYWNIWFDSERSAAVAENKIFSRAAPCVRGLHGVGQTLS